MYNFQLVQQIRVQRRLRGKTKVVILNFKKSLIVFIFANEVLIALLPRKLPNYLFLKKRVKLGLDLVPYLMRFFCDES